MSQENNSQDTFYTEDLDREEDLQEDYGDGFGQDKEPEIQPSEDK